MSTDEMDRLARANPVPAGSMPASAAPSPPPPAGRRRPRRVIGSILAAAGALSLVALIAALVVATPDDESAPATIDGTLRVALLDRPQVDADRVGIAPIPPMIDPASLRAAGHRASVIWFGARPVARPGDACLLRLGQDDSLRVAACRGIADGLVASVDRSGRSWRVIGLVPDGIWSVTVGDVSAPVRDNVFTLRVTGKQPEYAILAGPVAVAIPPAPNLGAPLVLATSRTPVVVVAFRPDGAAPELEPRRQRPPRAPQPVPAPPPAPSPPSARPSPVPPPLPSPRPVPGPPPAPSPP